MKSHITSKDAQAKAQTNSQQNSDPKFSCAYQWKFNSASTDEEDSDILQSKMSI